MPAARWGGSGQLFLSSGFTEPDALVPLWQFPYSSSFALTTLMVSALEVGVAGDSVAKTFRAKIKSPRHLKGSLHTNLNSYVLSTEGKSKIA
jgi:hypothetical protein